jgi:hypothetical protein
MLSIALLGLAMAGQAPADADAGAKTVDAADPTANDPRMMAEYARIVELLARVPEASVEVRAEWETAGEGPPQRGVNRCRARFAKPDRFHIEVLGDGNDPKPVLIIASDGRATTVHHPGRKLYTRHEHNGLVEALRCQAIIEQSLSGMMVDTLFRPDLVAVVEDHAARGRFEGTDTIDGRELNRYTLHWRGDDETLWVGPAAEPLPRKLIRVLRAPLGGKNAVTLTTTTTLTWKLGAGPGDNEGAFTIDLPADARQVEDLDTALALDPGEEAKAPVEPKP